MKKVTMEGAQHIATTVYNQEKQTVRVERPAPSADGRRRDFEPWPKIWAVRGKFGSNTAFFNLQAAERFINERERPENFHIFEYVPAPAPVSGEGE